MALTTTITPVDIATELGQNVPDAGSPTAEQWQMWIDDALMLIQNRADGLNAVLVDQTKINYVIRQAVADHVKRPDNATQVTVSVDDASTSRTYRSGAGRVTILDDWWTMLGLNPRRGRAFEVDTMPAGAGVSQDPDAMWYPAGWDL